LRRASKPTISITGQIVAADIASSGAAIAFTQLASLADGSILRGDGSAPVATALGTGASLTSAGVLTPSTGTITASHLVLGGTNLVNGLSTELTADIDPANDLVAIHDNSDNFLKKVRINKLLNAGVDTSAQSVTKLADVTSSAASVTIDLDGNPVQYVELNHSTVLFNNPTNMPSGSTIPSETAKSITFIIKNTTGGSCVYSFQSLWPTTSFLKSRPGSIAAQKTAVMAVTAYAPALMIVGYAAED
jgi:hypothetical protein